MCILLLNSNYKPLSTLKSKKEIQMRYMRSISHSHAKMKKNMNEYPYLYKFSMS